MTMIAMLRVGAAIVALSAVANAGAAALPADTDPSNALRNTDDIVVTATKVNKETPITASIQTTEPQAIVSRSIIENSIPPTADFSDVVLLTAGASSTSNGNGPGLTDSKTTLRGFKDGQFNITYDGIPFGDSNDPTHHSTSYFPNGTYERIIVDRGPGRATDLGQASYGGNIHIISRETTDKGSLDIQDVYGSFHTFLQRVGVQSGSIDKLGGLKIVAVGEYKQTDGALTGANGWFVNGFAKADLPVGDHVKLSLLGSYNQSLFHQSDSSGGATCFVTNPIKVTPGEVDRSNCDAGSQIGVYGKNYGGVVPGQAATSPWPSARTDWNWENKATDIEIFRAQFELTSNLSFDNKAYTYFYKNFTISPEDTSTPCIGIVANPATQCIAPGVKNTFVLNAAGKVVPGPAGDIAGFTKLNQYRQSGDIGEFTWVTPIGVGKAGFWYEHSQSKRYREDYDFTAASAAHAFGDYHFDIAAMANYFNYKEKLVNGAGQPTLQLGGTPVPQYVKYFEFSSWDQIQAFGEFEFHLFDDRLKLTPGVKVQNFTRQIDTPIAAQSSRQGIVASQSYKPTLPYFTANFLILPNVSTYFQFAKGFLIPSLGSSLETSGKNPQLPLDPPPTKTTNYQAGAVYAGDLLNIDADVYYIKTSNSSFVDPSNPNVIVVSTGPATYQGVEGQVSYRVLRGLTAIVNGSLASAKDDNSGLWLVQAPDYTALAGAVYNNGPLRLSYLHKFVGREYWYVDPAKINPSVRAAPYSLGIASASYQVGPVQLGVTVYNVFDDRSTTSIGGANTPIGAGYQFQSTRSFEGSVRLKF